MQHDPSSQFPTLFQPHSPHTQPEAKRMVKAVEDIFNPVYLFVNQQLQDALTTRKGYLPYATIYQQRPFLKYLQDSGYAPLSSQEFAEVSSLLQQYIPKYSKSLRANPAGVRLLRTPPQPNISQVYFQDIDYDSFDSEQFETLLASKCNVYQVKYFKEENSALVYTSEPSALLNLERELESVQSVQEGRQVLPIRVLKAEQLQRHRQLVKRCADTCWRQTSNIRIIPCLKKLVKRKVRVQGESSWVEQELPLCFNEETDSVMYTSCQKTEQEYLVRLRDEYEDAGGNLQEEQEEWEDGLEEWEEGKDREGEPY